jgi:hypothetical protein
MMEMRAKAGHMRELLLKRAIPVQIDEITDSARRRNQFEWPGMHLVIQLPAQGVIGQRG